MAYYENYAGPRECINPILHEMNDDDASIACASASFASRSLPANCMAGFQENSWIAMNA